MGRINVSCWLRLVAFPALLLAIAYAASALPAAADAQRGRLPSVASKQPYADSGSNRAKALRPARAQARVPKTAGADGKTEDSSAGSAVVLRSSQWTGIPLSAARRPGIASDAPFEPFPFRTHHPRDPPVA